MLGSTGPAGAERDYDVEELLEPSGGQGFVFRARLTTDRLGPGMAGTEVSLKQLIDGAVGVERIHELDAVIGPRTHPHLSRQLEVFAGPPVAVEGSDGDDDRDSLTYVAAAWVPGRTIDRAVGGASLDRVLRWINQVADAIDFLHADCHPDGPVLHRDIKPHNVIVDTTGRAVLIDPGLARPVIAGATGTPHGSPGYIPPEAQGGLRPSTAAGDRWQLAALTFCLIVGEPPGHMPMEEVREQLTRALKPTHRPRALVELIARMLDPDPGQRPGIADDWAHELRLAAAASVRPSRTERRAQLVTFAAAALAVIAAAGIGFLARPDQRPAAHASQKPSPPPSPNGYLATDSRILSSPPTGSRTVTIYNKVTDGPTMMREDVPAYLSTTTADFCREYDCMVPQTDMDTGVMLTATCQTGGQFTTNGDDQDSSDAQNPGRYSSTFWYFIQLPDGRHGYLSDVWLQPADRGGLGLPHC